MKNPRPQAFIERNWIVMGSKVLHLIFILPCLFLGSQSKASLSQSQKPTEKSSLNTEELLSKPIYDMARSPKKPNWYFISADRLYRSSDQKTWVAILDKANTPLATTQNGLLFAGELVSKDLGLSFQPYFRWEDLLSQLSPDLPSSKFRISRILV